MLMKKELHAIVIGNVSHKTFNERFFCYEKEVMPTSGRWIMDTAKKNGIFFESSEEARSFRDEVIAYAKRLYAEKQREKAEKEREKAFDEYLESR